MNKEQREEDFHQVFTSIWSRVKDNLKEAYPETPDYFWSIPDKFIKEAVIDYCEEYPEDEILWGRN